MPILDLATGATAAIALETALLSAAALVPRGGRPWRTLGRAAPRCALAAAGAAALGAAAGGRIGTLGLPAAVVVLLATPGAAACLLLVAAGRLEASGRLLPARGLARRAGFLALGAAPLVLLAAPVALGAAGWAAAAAFAASAGSALLGGLSRKPRPAHVAASLAHVAGLALVALSG